MRTGRPKPGNRSARSGRKRDPKGVGAGRPTSLTGRKSIAKDVANRVVPWLGARFAGLFWVSQRPLNGYARSTVGNIRNPHSPCHGDPILLLCQPTSVAPEVGRSWVAVTGTGRRFSGAAEPVRNVRSLPPARYHTTVPTQYESDISNPSRARSL